MNTTLDRTDVPGEIPPGDELHAGEYVLGVLDAASRASLQARIGTDRRFAGLVDAWEGRFAPWLLGADPVAPSPRVWLRVRARTGSRPTASIGARAWQSTAFWRAASALAAAASIAALAVALRAPAPPPVPVPIAGQRPPVDARAARPVTVLAAEDGAVGWIVTVSTSDRMVEVAPVPRPGDPSGLAHELWVIAAGQQPLSLGLVSAEQAHSIAIPDAAMAAFSAGSTLAVTLEPLEGMPHAAPTGPIVAKGEIQQI